MEHALPLIGDKFPELKVQTTHGPMELPKDFKGKWFVLFSHPADFTPVCTTEFHAFQTRFDDFRALDCELVGLSIDQVFSHIKWVQWIEENLGVKIEFPVIADSMGQVAKKLGLIHADGSNHTVRAVFIVDPKGTVRAILYYPSELGRNMDEILRMIKGLQTGDKHKVAIPANWPNNELIESRVIIPPASSEKDAEKRMEEYEGYDWWFCHKEID